jgi:hypothetical protein
MLSGLRRITAFLWIPKARQMHIIEVEGTGIVSKRLLGKPRFAGKRYVANIDDGLDTRCEQRSPEITL